jgi:hypothetical protein
MIARARPTSLGRPLTYNCCMTRRPPKKLVSRIAPSARKELDAALAMLAAGIKALRRAVRKCRAL